MPRPKGLPKSGGRKKGTPNQVTAKREAEIAASGLTPLDYMLGIMRAEHPNGASPEIIQAREELRFEAAKAAAPFVHARLQTTTLAGDPEKPLKVDGMSDLETARRVAFLMTKAADYAA
jgi:hypothetical protein